MIVVRIHAPCDDNGVTVEVINNDKRIILGINPSYCWDYEEVRVRNLEELKQKLGSLADLVMLLLNH